MTNFLKISKIFEKFIWGDKMKRKEKIIKYPTKLKPIMELTENQIKALHYMNQIAKIRDEMPYMRKLKSGERGKQIFSEFIEGFICDAFGLKRNEKTNQRDFDATILETNETVQIREITKSAPKVKNFRADFLITVTLNKKDFSVDTICVYPNHIVKKYTKNDSFRPPKEIREKYMYMKNGEWIFEN